MVETNTHSYETENFSEFSTLKQKDFNIINVNKQSFFYSFLIY